MPWRGCQCYWPSGLRSWVGLNRADRTGRRLALAAIAGPGRAAIPGRRRPAVAARCRATIGAQCPGEGVGGTAVVRPAALAKLADDPAARFGRPVLTELELRPPCRDLESHGCQLCKRAAVERI